MLDQLHRCCAAAACYAGPPCQQQRMTCDCAAKVSCLSSKCAACQLHSFFIPECSRASGDAFWAVHDI